MSDVHPTSEPSALQIMEDLKVGGTWLAAARDYVQRHCIGGDTVIWGSQTMMSLTMREIEEMALMIAVSAIKTERSKRRD